MAANPPIFCLNPSISGGSRSSWLYRYSARALSPPQICPAASFGVRRRSGDGLELGRCWRRDKRRLDALVARAGPPSSSTLVFAFVFPLSMVLGTIFASIRIADQLDEKYLEELARNGAEKEVNGRSEEELVVEDKTDSLKNGRPIPVGASSAPRSRNRPKRKV